MSDYLVLKPLSSNATVGEKRAPFYSYLSVNGLGSTITFSADYSGGNASDARWVAPKDAIITMMTVVVGDGSVAGNANLAIRFVPDLTTNGLTGLSIRDSSLNVIQDIFVSITGGLAAMACCSSNFTMAFSSAGGGVATNNEYIAAYYVNFVKKCGGGLFVKAGNNFGFPLNLNWSSAANVIIAVSGYFVG